MTRFPLAHAAHDDWRTAADAVLAQLSAQLAHFESEGGPTLALLYITDHFAEAAGDILAYLSGELPEITDWAGTVGVGIAVTGVEYFDVPALAVMLCDLPADQYRVFSGVAPLPQSFVAQAALVHADGATPDLADLLEELAERTSSGYLFGGLASSRGVAAQIAIGGDGFMHGQGLANGVFHGGLSGVAFGSGVALKSRVTQGCLPLASAHRITEAERNVVYGIDGEPALEVLLRELRVTLEEPQQALAAMRQTLAGLVPAPTHLADTLTIGRSGHFGQNVMVRHLVGVDPQRHGVALAEQVAPGMQLAFCRRDVQAARADLMRICAEVREEVEAGAWPMTGAPAGSLAAEDAPAQPMHTMMGAIYVSCAGRGGPHFGGPSAELQMVRRALGDVPLIGFFAGGEIAHRHLHSYTGVLTVFTGPGPCA